MRGNPERCPFLATKSFSLFFLPRNPAFPVFFWPNRRAPACYVALIIRLFLARFPPVIGRPFPRFSNQTGCGSAGTNGIWQRLCTRGAAGAVEVTVIDFNYPNMDYMST
jgi:hypothetical protein